jgi:hypothetical protein
VRHPHQRGAAGSGAAHATAIIQSETEEAEEEANSCLSLLSCSRPSFIEQSEKEVVVACSIQPDC